MLYLTLGSLVPEGLGIRRFGTRWVRALVAEEDDPVAEGPGLGELEIDPGG